MLHKFLGLFSVLHACERGKSVSVKRQGWHMGFGFGDKNFNVSIL